jgi:hypothetical protein
MLGFNPLSSAPISDLGALAPITGYISATDDNDTATLNATELDNGVISTTDENDTATINGTVVSADHVGTISATDGNDTATINGTVANPSAPLGGDGWTKEEWERAKRIDRKIAERQRKLMEAYKQEAEDRKQSIRALVDPSSVAKVKKTELQSKQEVKADIPLAETENLERSIRYLENQRNNILQSVAYRQEMARIQMNLAILEAQRLADQDDEDSILALLL